MPKGATDQLHFEVCRTASMILRPYLIGDAGRLRKKAQAKVATWCMYLAGGQDCEEE